MKFKNPSNGYLERIPRLAPLWVLLFGPFYFALKGVWNHAVFSLILAIVTFGLCWLAYPFFAKTILKNNYLRNGWILED